MSAAPWPENVPGTHEYLSVYSQIVMPVHPDTARHAVTTLAYSVACWASWAADAAPLDSVIRSSSSVISTLRPRAVNRAMFCSIAVGDEIWPRTKWDSKPTPPIGTPCCLSDVTRLSIAL